MNDREILRLIKKLSKRRHNRMVTLSKLKKHSAAHRKEIAEYAAFINDLGREINTLLEKL